MASDERLSGLKSRDPPSAETRRDPGSCFFEVRKKSGCSQSTRCYGLQFAMRVHPSSRGWWAAPMAGPGFNGQGEARKEQLWRAESLGVVPGRHLPRVLGRLPHVVVARALIGCCVWEWWALLGWKHPTCLRRVPFPIQGCSRRLRQRPLASPAPYLLDSSCARYRHTLTFLSVRFCGFLALPFHPRIRSELRHRTSGAESTPRSLLASRDLLSVDSYNPGFCLRPFHHGSAKENH